MISYKQSRRSFLTAVGGSVGLFAMLRNTEAQSEGETSPKRLFVTHHPVGTVPRAWAPAMTGRDYVTSRLLKPFEDAGLREDMIALFPLAFRLDGPGGGHEKGTVVMMTGTRTEITRTGQTEQDDPHAAGPSADQLLLSVSQELSDVPFASLYALCDDRIDFQEISTRCLRYGMQRCMVQGVQKQAEENIPLRPVMRPLELFTQVFGNLMPGGEDPAAIARTLAAKQSVLDFSKRELQRLRTLAPVSGREMLDAHEDAIRQLEGELQSMGDQSCTTMPPPDLIGGVDDGGNHNDYANPTSTTADDVIHAEIGRHFQEIIITAMKCDLTRVGLFQWSPGTNHIAFKGLWPGEPDAIYQHHPVSHRLGDGHIDGNDNGRDTEVEFMIRAEEWYNARTAEFVNRLKEATDVYGNSLLDNTIVPYLTEVGRATHWHHDIPAVIFGGKNLGLQGGQFIRPSGGFHNDVWVTIAAALGVDLELLKGQRGFMFEDDTYSGVIENTLAGV